MGRSYAIPERLESSHILLMGDTGSGKSPAIRQILRQVKERGNSAIVYDPAMDFVGEFYSPERGDLILNPLDARFHTGPCPMKSLTTRSQPPSLPRWCRRRSMKRHSSLTLHAGFWPICCAENHVRDLWMSDPEEIAARVKGTLLAAYLDPGAPAQRAGILSR